MIMSETFSVVLRDLRVDHFAANAPALRRGAHR